jgi:hypothetical protein
MTTDNFLKEILHDIREDVKDLRVSHEKQSMAMNGLEKRVDELTGLLGFQKKKGLLALLGAALTGGALASGTLNYPKIIEALLNGHR